MDSIAPPKASPDLPLSAARQIDPAPASEAAERRIAEHVAAMRRDVMPDKLVVQLDENAGRFVQTLTDVQTSETLRRYPNEAQLAYSRAVTAYLRALKA